MKPHYQTVKNLIENHVKLCDFTADMESKGVTMVILNNLDLFKIALDVIGFPPDIEEVDEFGNITPSGAIDRHKWDDIAYGLREEHIEPFVEELYAEYESYLLSKA